MRFSFVFIYIVAASLAACQRQSTVESPTAPVPVSKTEQLNHSLDIPPLVCAKPEHCPPSVGELISYTGARAVFCTFTLVAKDIVLTASHCVPWESVDRNGKFLGNCWVRFPNEGHQQTECTAVVSATRVTRNSKQIQLDHAFIRIARPQKHNVMGIDNNDVNARAIVLYGVRLGQTVHTIEMRVCARDDSFSVAPVKHIAGKTIVMPSCGVQQGFSGGPILSPHNRQIIGVVSGVIGYDSSQPDLPRPSIGTIVSRKTISELARVQKQN